MSIHRDVGVCRAVFPCRKTRSRMTRGNHGWGIGSPGRAGSTDVMQPLRRCISQSPRWICAVPAPGCAVPPSIFEVPRPRCAVPRRRCAVEWLRCAVARPNCAFPRSRCAYARSRCAYARWRCESPPSRCGLKRPRWPLPGAPERFSPARSVSGGPGAAGRGGAIPVRT
jgi:hypothetical protein